MKLKDSKYLQNRVKSIGCAALLFLAVVMPLHAAQDSLSDLSLESFEETEEQLETRNPFEPGLSDENVDISALNLEGIITGPAIRLCLISSRVLTEGQSIGKFLIKKIHPGHIIVQSSQGEHTVAMKSYVSQGENDGASFEIVFQNAGLKEALRGIAAAGNFNLIVSEAIDGRISVIFHKSNLDDAMRSILRVNNLDFVDENNIIRVGSPDDFATETKFVTKHIRLKYATAKNVSSSILPLLSEKGHVSSDPDSNIITVRDSQSFIDAVQDLIFALDKAAPQVHIEAKIVDVSRNFSRALGIQWGFTKDSGQIQGFGNASVGSISGTTNAINVNLPATAPTSGFGILLGNLINNTDLDIALSAAEENGDAHIISQPSVTTMDNIPASIRSGVKFYVKTTSSISVGGSGGSASADDTGLQEINTGIELKVTPQITPENTVRLKIDAEESEADFSRSVDGIPAVIDNTASTTVLVKDGQTTVIGGLMKVKKTNSKKGVPVISHIPLLGLLFKNNAKTRIDNELLIFITPYIVKKPSASPTKMPPQLSYEQATDQLPAKSGSSNKARQNFNPRNKWNK